MLQQMECKRPLDTCQHHKESERRDLSDAGYQKAKQRHFFIAFCTCSKIHHFSKTKQKNTQIKKTKHGLKHGSKHNDFEH